jgi:hypothetical protein
MLPSGAFWWLERREESIRYLDAHYRRTRSDEHGIICRLDEPEADGAWAG